MFSPSRKPRLHFVGIGGIGMSGIAEVFLNQGYPVSGSDLSDSETTRRLASLGARIAQGHRAENVGEADVVVISSAVRASNPEVEEARRRRIPVIPRAEMLGELMRGKTGIAVAGTHGKTSTTTMVASILSHAGLDPTIVVGGKVDSLGGTNAKLGQGSLVVAEADESDGSFLHLPATFGIITNIDNDHLDHYGSLQAIDAAFVEFVAKLPFYGLAAVCGDDPGVKRCLSRFTKPVKTYGFGADNDLVAGDVRPEGLGSSFEILRRGQSLGRARIQVPGRHNVLNALAATSIALELGVEFSEIARGLESYAGVKRRFELRLRDESRGILVVDDYGHHPTEVQATLAAARSWWKGRIVTVFQPHRYSRTLHCRDGFLASFGDSDLTLLTDIYAAGEEPIAGVSSQALVQELSARARPGQEFRYVGSLEGARHAIERELKPGDLVLCLGAGSITQLPTLLEPLFGRARS